MADNKTLTTWLRRFSIFLACLLALILVLLYLAPAVAIFAADRWYRWRLIFAAVDGIITPALGTCEIGLLAKDGIYLHDAPRTIASGYMGPGSRADWLVRCPAGVHSFITNGRRRLQPRRLRPRPSSPSPRIRRTPPPFPLRRRGPRRGTSPPRARRSCT